MNNIEFEKHILTLLKDNDCVVLPGFGGFILKCKPSSIHHTTIYPPSKQIAFNSGLQHEDELLTGALMHAYALAYNTAKNEVASYANHLSYTLKKNQQLTLKQIGAFTIGENNQIIFKPFLSTFVDKESFGLNKLHIKPIQKTIVSKKKLTKLEVVKQEDQKLERKAKTRKFSRTPILGLIGSLVLMTGIAGLVATNTTIDHPNVQHAGFVDMLFPNDTFVESFNNETEIYTESYLNPSEQKEGYKTGKLLSFQREDMLEGYYVVLGSYSSKSNAERMEASLFASGKDSYIIPSENGFYRVCEFADTNYLNAKQKVAETYKKGAWLLKNRH